VKCIAAAAQLIAGATNGCSGLASAHLHPRPPQKLLQSSCETAAHKNDLRKASISEASGVFASGVFASGVFASGVFASGVFASPAGARSGLALALAVHVRIRFVQESADRCRSSAR
jgi:hypothetical protein